MQKEIKIKGNVALIGFEVLEPVELEKIQKIVMTYIKKLSEVCSFEELKLTLQQHQKGKSFKHEINGVVFIDKNTRFTASVTKWNLYNAVSDVCEKIYTAVVKFIKKEQRHDKLTYQR
ncbi:MAG: hypothetical protein QW041_00990 [Candidatus Pacearchaeota archaeon]